MRPSFLLRSRDGGSISLTQVDDSHLRATLAGLGVSAEATVWYSDSLGLADFFRRLAVNWKGWNGKRTWASEEDELSIEAASDRRGHISTTVRLQDRILPTWRVELLLVLEAGQLEGIARDATRFEATLARTGRTED